MDTSKVSHSDIFNKSCWLKLDKLGAYYEAKRLMFLVDIEEQARISFLVEASRW